MKDSTGQPYVQSAPPSDGARPVSGSAYQPPSSVPDNLTTTNASSSYSYANSTGGTSPTKSGASPKIVALVVGIAVVVVTGIFIFANSNDSNPERADSSSAPANPSNSDDYVEEDVDNYAPAVEYSSWDDYPTYLRSNYLDACSNGTYSNYNLCLCTLEAMEETYTWEEAQEIDYAATQGEDISWLYDGLISMCT
jgi:hypothetical protein